MLSKMTDLFILNGVMTTVEDDIKFIDAPVYEVIRVMDGIPLFVDGHLERLFTSLRLLQIDHDYTQLQFISAILKLVRETGIRDNNIRLEVGYIQEETLAWVLYWVETYYPEKEVYEKGVFAVTETITRENPHAKIYRDAYARKISSIRRETGAFEVILIKENGVITEGSRSNLFFVKDDVIYSALESDVLKGITRNKVKALSGFNFLEKNITVNELSDFDACFLTGTSIHILPIYMIDDVSYHSSQNPLILSLIDAFHHTVINDIENTRRKLND